MRPEKAEWMEPNKRLGKPQIAIYYFLMFVTVWDQNPKSVIKNTIMDIGMNIGGIINDIWSIIYKILSLIIIPIQLLCYILIGMPVVYILIKNKFIQNKFYKFMSKELKNYAETADTNINMFFECQARLVNIKNKLNAKTLTEWHTNVTYKLEKEVEKLRKN